MLVLMVVVFECNPTRPPGRPALYHSLSRCRIRLYPRAWYFRSASWVRIPPSAYSYTFSSCALIDLRKARERELATLDEKTTSSGCSTLCAKKMKAITGGGKERTTPVTTACMSRSWKVEVCQNKIMITWRDDQSAISSKEHVKYEATQTYLSVTYQHHRLHLTGKRPQQRSQGPQQQQSTPSTHISPKCLVGKKTPNNSIRGRMHASTGFFRGYCLLTTTFAWRSLTTGRTCTIQPSRPWMQLLALLLCGFSWRSNRNHYYFLLI